MNPQSRQSAAFRVIIPTLITLAVVVAIISASRPPAKKAGEQPTNQVQAAAAPTKLPSQTSPTNNSAKSPALSPGVSPSYPDFQKRPLSVAYESPNVQWTLADGKDTNVIRQLAHNPLEYDRMVEENPRIFKRQLVYLKQTAVAVVEQAKLTGTPVRQLTLPGVDGQEVRFEITATDLKPSGEQGMFSGHVAGQPDSMVTFAFKGGREAFTVLSPSDKLYLVAEPREPGEIIVKKIDPETYTAGANCGNQ